jgi:HEAT repeat protein
MNEQNRDIDWLLREGEFFSLSPQQLIDEVEKSPQDYDGFVNELCELTKHVDNYIKEKAAFALGVIGNPMAINCLIDLLNNEDITEMIKDGSYEARVEAGFALAKIGGEPASEALKSLIRSHENKAFVGHLTRALRSMDDIRMSE